MKPSEVLDAAADKITPEGAWTQGHGARLRDGSETSSGNTDAVCWCIQGAILAIADGYDARSISAERYVARCLGLEDIVEVFDWNDDGARTQDEVIAAIRQAAELARAEGK